MTRDAPRAGLLVLTLSLAVTTLSLLQSLVVPMLPVIGQQLGVGAGAAGWVLTANLLAAAVLTPVIGRLGDTLGERRVVLGVLVVISAGTLLAVLTTSLPLLLVARVLQGASYGLFPLSISILRRELPAERLTIAMSVVSSTLAVGGVIGLVVTGLLTRDGGNYHRPFWLGLAIALVALALAAWALPDRPASATGGVDWWGAVVLGTGLVLLLLPLSQGHTWGWASPATLGCLAGAVVVLAGWVLLQRRRTHPLVRPQLLADRRMLVPNVAGLMTGFGLFASFLAVTQFVQVPAAAGYGFGASTLEAAVVYLLPGGVVGIVLAPFAGQVVSRIGGETTLLIGAASGLVGFTLFALARSVPWVVVLVGLLTQLAVTVAFAALPALVVQAVDPSETGVANGVNSITRSVGSALASALIITVVAGSADATGLPSNGSFTVVAVLGGGSALVTGLVALWGRRSSRRRPDELADVERATACAGEWSPVSGIR
ncbi:MFS transporter [Klenkia brasiliensis]|uniref:Major Facilitator Superfamily protein n=1 Tax=Klenkia brasiliensis TaxID=333142 RepID=A0A1G7QNF7_9ACTN|nr:MFS transporter [Klenkia brasiliensis]SDG00077.1 Major Facilitator Superfamily protein [Klenkia brasiliensis]